MTCFSDTRKVSAKQSSFIKNIRNDFNSMLPMNNLIRVYIKQTILDASVVRIIYAQVVH